MNLKKALKAAFLSASILISSPVSTICAAETAAISKENETVEIKFYINTSEGVKVHTVDADPDWLGPNGEMTVEFIARLDPFPKGLKDNEKLNEILVNHRRSTDFKHIKPLWAHLESHFAGTAGDKERIGLYIREKWKECKNLQKSDYAPEP